MPSTFRTPFFVLTNFSALSENSTFEFLTRFCFNHLGVPLASNPRLLRFLHTVCQRFCQPSEPCFSFCSTDNGKMGRGGGRGVKCEGVGSVFNHEFSLIRPPKLIIFNPLHCYKKSIHAAGYHHWSRQNIRLIRTGWSLSTCPLWPIELWRLNMLAGCACPTGLAKTVLNWLGGLLPKNRGVVIFCRPVSSPTSMAISSKWLLSPGSW